MRTSRRVVPPASISVHYSPLSAAQTSSRSSSAPWSSYSACIFRNTSSVPHYCTHRPPQGTQRLRQQAPHPKSALRCEVYGMHRHTGREGVYVYLLHNVGNISRTTICKFSSIMSVAPLAPACTTQMLSHPLDLLWVACHNFPTYPR